MPTLNAQIEALEIAFIELAKSLGREQFITVTQLATSLETAAKNSKSTAEITKAVSELARRLR